MAYMIGRADWGRGLGTEAARAARDLAFGNLGLPRVVSIIHRGNLASRRVAEKVGMRHERIVQFADHRCSLYAMAVDRPSPVNRGRRGDGTAGDVERGAWAGRRRGC